MLHGARKKRKLSSPAASVEKGIGDNAFVSKRVAESLQKREKERVLLARASVIKEKYRRLVVAYDTPWREPPNNATHWDHLLSEATWMWNDIAQERLWKKAVAKQLALEAVQYWESHFSNHSSSSSTEIVVLPQVFGIPFGRQLRGTLQEMARKRHRKKTLRYEKTLRKFQREYEIEELAAVYGFEADEGFGLLNIKIPTQPCIAAPNEVEKDVYIVSPPKSVPNRRPDRTKPPRTPAGPKMLENEEMIANGPLVPCSSSRRGRDREKGVTPTRIPVATAETATSRTPRRATRHAPEWNVGAVVSGSEISISQPELETKQKTPTINDFLAKNEDRLLFFASNELQDNWQIVSDVMASAGIYMTPEACCERLKSIQNNITQAQSHLLRPRAQGTSSAQGFSDDILFRQLRSEAKDVLRKSIPDNMAAKLTPLTCNVHKKRCLRMKAAMNEGNIGSPSYHISQCKLSEGIMKNVRGQLLSPKDSWKMAHSRNIAWQMIDIRKHQVEAASMAARGKLMRSAVSQPPSANGGTSLETQSKYPTSQQQQQTSMQAVENWTDMNRWGPQTGMQNAAAAGFTNSAASVGGVTGAAPIQAPWIPPPDVFNGLAPWPNLMGSANGQGQSSLEPSSIMSPPRTGFNLRNVPSQHVMGAPPPQVSPPEPQMHNRPQPGGRPPMLSNYAQNQHQIGQIFRQCRNNPNKLKQFLHSNDCSPNMRQLIIQALQDPSRVMKRGAVNPQLGTHPSQLPQRMGQLAPAQQGMPSNAASRVSQPVVSAADPYGNGNAVPGLSQGNFVAAPELEHPSQYNTRVTAPLQREFSDPHTPHGMRPRPQRSSFPSAGYDLGGSQLDPFAMNADLQQAGSTAAMFGAMSMRMHGVGPEVLNPAAPSQMDIRPGLPADSRHPLHGVPSDSAAAPMLDPSYPLGGGDDNPPDGNFPSDTHSMNTRSSIPHYPRTNPGHFGK